MKIHHNPHPMFFIVRVCECPTLSDDRDDKNMFSLFMIAAESVSHQQNHLTIIAPSFYICASVRRVIACASTVVLLACVLLRNYASGIVRACSPEQTFNSTMKQRVRTVMMQIHLQNLHLGVFCGFRIRRRHGPNVKVVLANVLGRPKVRCTHAEPIFGPDVAWRQREGGG